MISPSWVILLTSAFLGVDGLRARSNWQFNERDPSINAASPFDHSWIESFASLGDSYSVGLGAGHYVKAAKGVHVTPARMTEPMLTKEFSS